MKTLLVLDWLEISDSETPDQKTLELSRMIADSLMIYGLKTVTPVYQSALDDSIDPNLLNDLITYDEPV